jgi:hypothetical protein
MLIASERDGAEESDARDDGPKYRLSADRVMREVSGFLLMAQGLPTLVDAPVVQQIVIYRRHALRRPGKIDVATIP